MNKCKECFHYKNDCEFSKSEPTNGEYVACGQFEKDGCNIKKSCKGCYPPIEICNRPWVG